MDFTTEIDRKSSKQGAGGLSVTASGESQRSTPQTSRTAKEVLVSLREELKDKGKDPGVPYIQFRVNTDDLLLPVHSDDAPPAPTEEQRKDHPSLSRTSSADYEFLAEDQKAAAKSVDKDKAKS